MSTEYYTGDRLPSYAGNYGLPLGKLQTSPCRWNDNLFIQIDRRLQGIEGRLNKIDQDLVLLREKPGIEHYCEVCGVAFVTGSGHSYVNDVAFVYVCGDCAEYAINEALK